MKKLFPGLNTRDICILGLLASITALLSIFCTFRIGTVVKIPLKFISVFVTAALYGPFWGGVCAATGDILNCLLAPVGPFVPQVTVLEFVSGFLFGLFFLKNTSKQQYIIMSIFCSISQLFLDLIINTAVFTFSLGWFPSFWSAFWIRLPASLIKFLLNLAVLISFYPLLNRLKALKIKGEKTL